MCYAFYYALPNILDNIEYFFNYDKVRYNCRFIQLWDKILSITLLNVLTISVFNQMNRRKTIWFLIIIVVLTFGYLNKIRQDSQKEKFCMICISCCDFQIFNAIHLMWFSDWLIFLFYYNKVTKLKIHFSGS